MDLKDLNNYQLVLLTLLISFVTSIATGIVTVYLLQESPAVSSVINQVIERTIEKTVPDSVASQIQPTQSKTIIIKEDDLVAEALARGFKQTGAIYTKVAISPASNDPTVDPATVLSGDQTVLISQGILIDAKGRFVTSGNYSVTPKDFVVIGTNTYSIASSVYNKESDITVLSLRQGDKTAAFADLKSDGIGATPKIGQTALVIGLAGKFIKTTVSQISKTEITLQDTLSTKLDGAPVLSTEGLLIGIVAMSEDGTMHVYPPETITSALTAVAAAAATPK